MNDDILLDENNLGSLNAGNSNVKESFMKRLKKWWRNIDPKVRTSIFVTIAVVLGISAGGWVLSASGILNGGLPSPGDTGNLDNRNNVDLPIENPVEPKDNELPLTGEKVTKSDYTERMKKLPLSVVIENHPDARQQSGLDQADVVLESLAEGGITRFVAVFFSKQPETVGPVRSLRKYFVDFISGFGDAMIMHVGAATSTNPEANALAEVQKYGVKSLGVSGGRFWRVDYKFPPHNAYTSTKELWTKAQENGWVGPFTIRAWKYKDGQTPADEAAATSKVIRVNWDGWGQTAWSTKWEFDAQQNVYKRFHVDSPHTDAVSGKPITASNVAIVFAPFGAAQDGSARVVFDIIGQGHGIVFRDGQPVDGTWKKASRTDQFIFTDSKGDEVSFNRGNTWVMVVPDGSEVIF